MINSVFKHGGGGSKGVFDYMLKDPDNPRLAREGATVLRGDVEIQKALIDSLVPKFKQQYVAGCWSFEEAPDQVTEAQKNEIMDGTEKLMLAGLDPSRVSISWIEHTDKGRLELNYIVACVDLEHGRQFQPYMHSHDVKRWNAFKDIQNITHGYSDPNDPVKARTFSQTDNLPRTTKELKEAITGELENQVIAGLITNRDDVKQALTEMGYTITRDSKNSISIKNPDPDGRNIKFKSTNEGGLYDIKFNASAEIASEISRASEDFRRSAGHRLAEAQRVFEQELDRKRDYHQNRHFDPLDDQRRSKQSGERLLGKHEHGNDKGTGRLYGNHTPNPSRRTGKNVNAAQRAQRFDDADNANAQRKREYNHQDSIKAIFDRRSDMGSPDITVRHNHWTLYSKNILNPIIKNEVKNEQAATRPNRTSDESPARHDSASEFDARSERSRYKSLERLTNEIVRSANSASRRVASSFAELERINEIVNTTSSNVVASTVKDTEQSADFDERIISTGAESDKLNKSNGELSERITTLDDLEARSGKLRARIRSAEPFTEKNQHGVDKIERYIEVKEEQDRAQHNAKPEPLPEAPKPEPSYPTPFDSPYKPPSPFR